MSQTRTGDSSRAVLMYVGLLGAAALALLVPAIKYGPLPDDWTPVVVLSVLSFLSWRTKGERVAERTALSFASIIILASVALTGPLGAAAVGAVSPLAGVRQQPAQQRIFNVAMNSLIAGLAAFVYVGAGGLPAHQAVAEPVPLIERVGLPLIAADLAMCVANALLLAGVMRLTRGIPLRRFVTGMLTSSGSAYVGYGLIGYLFAILWVPADVGPFSALLVLSPLVCGTVGLCPVRRGEQRARTDAECVGGRGGDQGRPHARPQCNAWPGCVTDRRSDGAEPHRHRLTALRGDAARRRAPERPQPNPAQGR